MKTRIMSLEDVSELAIYVNENTPAENLVFWYLYNTKQFNRTLHPDFDVNVWIKRLGITSRVSTITGENISFSIDLNLMARQN